MIKFIWKYGKGNEAIELNENFDEKNNNDLEFSREENSNYVGNRSVNPSDYLFDIHFTKLMKKTVESHEYDIKDENVDLGYDKLQKFFSYNKGLLYEIDKTVERETSDNDLREQVFQVINYWRNVWNGQVEYINDEDRFPYTENSIFYKEVVAIDNYYNAHYEYPPYYLFERMVEKISPLMKERRQLVKMIRYTSPYKHTYLSQSGHALLTCQMVLDENNYNDFIYDAKEKITKYAEDTINEYLSSSTADDRAFLNSVNNMISCIESCDKGGNHNFGRYRGNKKGCFSIFDTATDKYVSLSGPFDVTDSSIETYLKISEGKKVSNNQLKNKIHNIILADSTLCGAKYSNLNLRTKRFPYSSKTLISSNGETVQDAMNSHVSINEIESDYSCCERKIFSCIPNIVSGDCYMFARHEPCEKCRPAIKKVLNKTSCNMRIFYYDNNNVKEFDMSTL